MDDFFDFMAVDVAAGSTIRASAKKLGMSETNAYRIASTQEFRARVSELRSEAMAQAVGRLTNAATLAVDTLTSLLGEENEPTVRLQASKAILANLAPISEFAELRKRLADLESKITKPEQPLPRVAS